VQILAGDLRQLVELALQGLVVPRIRVAEIDRRIPHLQIEKRRAGGIVKIAAFAAVEDLRRFLVVDRVAERAVRRLVGKKLAFIHW
jgi:hypothetical protein